MVFQNGWGIVLRQPTAFPAFEVVPTACQQEEAKLNQAGNLQMFSNGLNLTHKSGTLTVCSYI